MRCVKFCMGQSYKNQWSIERTLGPLSLRGPFWAFSEEPSEPSVCLLPGYNSSEHCQLASGLPDVFPNRSSRISLAHSLIMLPMLLSLNTKTGLALKRTLRCNLCHALACPKEAPYIHAWGKEILRHASFGCCAFRTHP